MTASVPFWRGGVPEFQSGHPRKVSSAFLFQEKTYTNLDDVGADGRDPDTAYLPQGRFIGMIGKSNIIYKPIDGCFDDRDFVFKFQEITELQPDLQMLRWLKFWIIQVFATCKDNFI